MTRGTVLASRLLSIDIHEFMSTAGVFSISLRATTAFINDLNMMRMFNVTDPAMKVMMTSDAVSYRRRKSLRNKSMTLSLKSTTSPAKVS